MPCGYFASIRAISHRQGGDAYRRGELEYIAIGIFEGIFAHPDLGLARRRRQNTLMKPPRPGRRYNLSSVS